MFEDDVREVVRVFGNVAGIVVAHEIVNAMGQEAGYVTGPMDDHETGDVGNVSACVVGNGFEVGSVAASAVVSDVECALAGEVARVPVVRGLER